ncbi:MAG: PKD domain-containing protein [Methanoculleus sp.]
MAVGADEEVLYVNVTANGLPVGANVTMTVNGTETAKTAVSGIATFPNVENYRLKAEMLFFAPAEFITWLPSPLSLKSNRTVLDQAVVFNASASQDSDGWIVEYHWDFGDGHEETTTSGYALHPFNATGHYTVNLTVVDNDGLCSRSPGILPSSRGALLCSRSQKRAFMWVIWMTSRFRLPTSMRSPG